MSSEIDFGKIKIDAEDIDKAKEKILSLKDGLPSAEQAIDKLAESFLKVPGPIGLVVAGLAAVAAGLVTASLAAQEHIEQLNHLSESYGLTASQADLMGEAAKRSGSSLGSVEAVYAKVAKAAYAANDPLKGTGAAFKELGISILDSSGHLKSATDLTDEAVKAWDEGAKTTADFAAAQKILGKNFLEQLPALEAVKNARELADQQAEKGIYISKESVEATENHSKATLAMKGIMDAFGSQLVTLIIPQITNMVTWFNKSAESGGLVRGIMDGLIITIKALYGAGGALVDVFIGINAVIQTLGKSLGMVLIAFDRLNHGDFSGAGAAIKNIGNIAKTEFDGMVKGIDAVNKGIKEFGATNTQGTQQDKKTNPFANAGGDPRASPFKQITEAVGAAEDPFAKYKTSLDKMAESTEHLSESQKAALEIQRLTDEAGLKNMQIAAENADRKSVV